MLQRLSIASLLVIMFAGIAVSPAAPAAAQVDDLRAPRYFEATGFWVQGDFRVYWETRGGLHVFGNPITGVFYDEQFALYTQYFERAVFEYHIKHARTEYAVQLKRLGVIRVEGRGADGPFEPRQGIIPDGNCDFFVETGHRLCAGFREYWTNNGGVPVFGFPISEEFEERNQPPPAGDGQIYTVQYFERARVEWHPENRGTGYEFLLGLLGTEHLARNGAPGPALARQPASEAPADPTALWASEPGFRYGFNIAWSRYDDHREFNGRTMRFVGEAGFGAVRIQALWSYLEPEPGRYDFRSIERLLSAAEMHQRRVLVSIVHTPTWALPEGEHEGIPVDVKPFEDLMRALTAHFGARVDAWEIWNEQNLAYEVGGYVDVGRYVELLKAGYRGAKAGYPDAYVLFGGLTPTGVDDPTVAVDDALYLQRVFAYNGGEVKNHYDALGAHPGGNNNHPDQFWPDNPGTDGWSDHRSFYFRRIEDLRAVMVANGEGHKPIWITEFGWTTANPAPGYEYGVHNSEAEQAAYMTRAFEIARAEWPWVHAMFVWNLNFEPVVDPLDEKGAWSVLNKDWSPRPAYEALRAMQKN